MKYLKVFESKILDDILDKISDDGEKNLTSWEREYLASFSDVHKRNDMEKQKMLSDKPEFVEDELDPSMYPNEDGTIDPIYDEFTESEDHWNSVDDNDLNEFFEKFELPGNYGDTHWEDIPREIKKMFKTFLMQKGYIER